MKISRNSTRCHPERYLKLQNYGYTDSLGTLHGIEEDLIKARNVSKVKPAALRGIGSPTRTCLNLILCEYMYTPHG